MDNDFRKMTSALEVIGTELRALRKLLEKHNTVALTPVAEPKTKGRKKTTVALTPETPTKEETLIPDPLSRLENFF